MKETLKTSPIENLKAIHIWGVSGPKYVSRSAALLKLVWLIATNVRIHDCSAIITGFLDMSRIVLKNMLSIFYDDFSDYFHRATKLLSQNAS